MTEFNYERFQDDEYAAAYPRFDYARSQCEELQLCPKCGLSLGAGYINEHITRCTFDASKIAAELQKLRVKHYYSDLVEDGVIR